MHACVYSLDTVPYRARNAVQQDMPDKHLNRRKHGCFTRGRPAGSASDVPPSHGDARLV